MHIWSNGAHMLCIHCVMRPGRMDGRSRHRGSSSEKKGQHQQLHWAHMCYRFSTMTTQSLSLLLFYEYHTLYSHSMRRTTTMHEGTREGHDNNKKLLKQSL